MFVIFGWMKESQHQAPLLDTWCYHCNSKTTWHLCNETEWVTFFDIRTLPFNRKYFISCEKCHDEFSLDSHVARDVLRLDGLSAEKSQQLHDRLVAELEKYQLAGKTERQLQYIRAFRSDDNKS